MATYEDYLKAAANAEKAGDIAARDRLLGAAAKVRQQPVRIASGPEDQPRAEWTPPTQREPRIDRFGDTIRDTVEEPLAMTKRFAGQFMDPNRNRFQRMGDAAMTGLSALGTGMAFGAGVIGETFGGNPTEERKLAGDLMGAAQVAVPELAGVSSTTRVAGAAARKLGVSPTEGQLAAQAAADLGITPSLGMTGKAGAVAASGLEKTVLTGGRIGGDAARAAEEIEAAAAGIVSRIGDAQSPFGAGQTLQKGLNDYVTLVKRRADQMFADVGRYIPPSTSVSLQRTQQAVADLKRGFENNPQLAGKLGLNEWDRVMAEAAQNGTTWEAVRKFRSDVGRAIGEGRGALGDEDTARLKALYGALTGDMEDAARAAGPEALGKWKAANRFYKNSADRIESNLDGLIKDGVAPERAFEAFYSAALGNRSSSDITRIMNIKGSMNERQWSAVSASIVDRLGKATPGAQNAAGDKFSPATFLTNWNKLSPEAKRILLKPDAKVELDRLMRVAERAKAAGMERNASNTGNITSGVALAYGASAAPVTTALTSGALVLGARALTDVRFLRALNRAQRGDAKALAAMASGPGPFRADAAEVLRLLAANTADAPSEPGRATAR